MALLVILSRLRCPIPKTPGTCCLTSHFPCKRLPSMASDRVAHFKDYKSAAFNVLQSGLRTAQALTYLFMLRLCFSDGFAVGRDAGASWGAFTAWAGIESGLEFSATGSTGTIAALLRAIVSALARSITQHQPKSWVCFSPQTGAIRVSNWIFQSRQILVMRLS